MEKYYFGHEKLTVYRNSLEFIEWVSREILNKSEKQSSVYDQLDRASTSIPLNLAEGNGKFTSKDRCRYFNIAWGSALECAACLDILYRKGVISETLLQTGKSNLKEIVSMIIGLIRANSDRTFENADEYEV